MFDNGLLETSMDKLDINTLYIVAQKGDPAAEELLFKCLNARFRVFVRRRLWGMDDWEDVVQEALALVSAEYKQIRIKSSFAAWAYQVLRNKMLSYSQTKSRRAARTMSHIRRRLLDCLHRIGSANRRYARILNFHYLGYSTEEICQRLNVRRENFYSVLSRARSMLEKCLAEGGIGL